MTALAEALLTAQRGALAAMQKAYLRGSFTRAQVEAGLDEIGCTDTTDTALFLAALDVMRQLGTEPPTNGKPAPEAQPASDKQLTLIKTLADEKGFIPPDGALTKQQASQVITAMQDGTYNADKWTAPF